MLAAVEAVIEETRPAAYERPIPYLERTVDLSADVTSAANGLIRIREVTPYLVDIIEYFAERGKRRLTVQAVEQTAKSTSWKMGLIWREKFLPGPAGIIYQNRDVGRNIIRDSLLPLMRCDEDYARALPKREGEAPARLKLPYSVLYLMTGDGPVISFPMSVIIGDEINKWRQESANRKRKRVKAEDDYQVSKIKDMDKRLRTFPDSLRVLVCSPEGMRAPITLEYMQSSRGVWYDRCAECGELVFDTTDPAQYFRYTADEHGTVDPDSVRLVCPLCGHSHEERRDKLAITRTGGYKHEFPERLAWHAGFCFGALASQMPGVDWLTICTAIENAKRDHGFEAQAFYRNSICGLPYAPDVVTGDRLGVVRSHAVHELLPATVQRFVAVYLGVDTQEVGYWWSVEAVDDADNRYTLAYGYAYDDDAVQAAWDAEYFGIQPMAAIIDEGGHRGPDVDALVRRLGAGVYKYKGEKSRLQQPWRVSENDPLLVLGCAGYYQRELLYRMYAKKGRQNHDWLIVADMKKHYVQQMAAFLPPPNDPEAPFEAWTHEGRQHDLFDCNKMTYCLHDFAKAVFGPDFFRRPVEGMAEPAVIAPPSNPMFAR